MVVVTIAAREEVQDYRQDFQLAAQGSEDSRQGAQDNLMVAPDTEGCLMEVQDIESYHLPLPEVHSPR